MAWIDQRGVRQRGELLGEGVVELRGMATVMAVAGAGVEQGVTAEQRRRVGVGQQADMTQGVTGGVERFEFDAGANLNHIARAQAAIESGNAVLGIGVGENLGAGGSHYRAVATRVIVMLVGVQHLGDTPAARGRRRETLGVVERIDGQRLAGLPAGDEIVEITVGVASPDLLDDHTRSPSMMARRRGRRALRDRLARPTAEPRADPAPYAKAYLTNRGQTRQ